MLDSVRKHIVSSPDPRDDAFRGQHDRQLPVAAGAGIWFIRS